MGETHTMSVEQIVGIVLTRLKQITEENLQAKMVDCVISVPTHFTDTERRAMLDAASIAGLNCVRLLNETTAGKSCWMSINDALHCLSAPNLHFLQSVSRMASTRRTCPNPRNRLAMLRSSMLVTPVSEHPSLPSMTRK